MSTPTSVVLKSIPSSPNEDYRAGSDGQIYSRTRYKGFGRKEYVGWYPLVGRTPKGKGYRSVSLCHENVKVTKSVHKLVCLAFHGEPPEPTMQVRHLDGDKTNCRPDNLQWGTQEENWQDRRAHGRACEGEAHWASKLTDVEREHVRWAVAKGLCSGRHAAKILGMSPASISALLRSK